MDNLENIKTLISNGHTRQALLALDNFVVNLENSKWSNQIVILNSRLSHLNDLTINGTLKNEEADIVMNQVNYSILLLTDEIMQLKKNVIQFGLTEFELYQLFCGVWKEKHDTIKDLVSREITFYANGTYTRLVKKASDEDLRKWCLERNKNYFLTKYLYSEVILAASDFIGIKKEEGQWYLKNNNLNLIFFNSKIGEQWNDEYEFLINKNTVSKKVEVAEIWRPNYHLQRPWFSERGIKN